MNFQEFYAGDLFSAYSFLGAHPLQEGFVFRVLRQKKSRSINTEYIKKTGLLLTMQIRMLSGVKSGRELLLFFMI